MITETIVFAILATVIAIFSILSVTTKRIVRSATYLLAVLFGTAGMYFLLGYTFLGSVQMMVYAGGVVVLYVFAIMLTGKTAATGQKRLSIKKRCAALAATLAGTGLLMSVFAVRRFGSLALDSTVTNESAAPIEELGGKLLSSGPGGYLLPFEAVSVLLLACIIGGLIIARKR